MSKKTIESVLNEERRYDPPVNFARLAIITTLLEYEKKYRASVDHPEIFWGEVAQDFYWKKKFDQVLSYSFGEDLFVKWFEGGQTNLCYNALDRHLPRLKDKVAFVYVPNEGETQKITYDQLFHDVVSFSNGLKKIGLKKGDRVAIYMPMIPEAAVAMLACARLGIIHNVVFGGFSAQSLADRIRDSEACLVITANELLR